MGARGPAPRPARLKLLNGTSEGRDSGGRKVKLGPNFRREAPEPPSWLDDEAAAEWRRVAPGLERLDVLKVEDGAALAVYCLAWSRFVDAVKQYQRDGMTLVNEKTGVVHPHPAVRVAQTAAHQMLLCAREFGLTPSAEQRLASLSPDGGNPFAWNG